MNSLRGAIIPVTPLQQNCALLWDDATKHAWIVDPGGDVPRIRDAVAELGLSVQRILLTHGHIDHAGGAALLRESLPGVPLQGPDERDAFLLDGLEDQGRRFGVAGARNVRPDRFLVEGDTLELGGHHFEVLHCPGHTPGHIVFVDRAGGLAILGDVLFQGSVGRTDFPYGDTGALSGLDPRQADDPARRDRLPLRPRSRLHHWCRAPQQPLRPRGPPPGPCLEPGF